MDTALITCPRCSGTGRTRFAHVEGGVCFRCQGEGRCAPAPKAAQPTRPFDADLAAENMALAIAGWITREGSWSSDAEDFARARAVAEALR